MIALNFLSIRPLAILYGIFFSILAVAVYTIVTPETIKVVSSAWAAVSVAILVAFSLLFYSVHATLNRPYFYFIVTAFVCWFGQAVGAFLPTGSGRVVIIDTFDPLLLHAAFLYATLSLLVLCVVGLLFNNKGEERNYTSRIENTKFRGSLSLVGTVMALAGAGTYFSRILSNLQVSLAEGYSSVYDISDNVSATGNILSNLELFFVPGMFILLIANKGRRRRVYFISCVIALSAVLSLLSGGRGGAMSLIIALFWLMSVEFKKIGSLNKVLLVGAAFLLMSVLGVFAEFRLLDDRSFQSFMALLLSGGMLSAAVSALNEFGFNIFSLYHTMGLIPLHQEYSYGYTYFASVMAIIPSLFFGGFSFASKADLPRWLQDSLAMDYGPGFSITAESYYNFGWLGLVAIALIGYILSRLFSNQKDMGDSRSLRNVFIATALYATLLLARGTTLLTFRKYFYMIILPALAIYVVYWWRKSKAGRRI